MSEHQPILIADDERHIRSFLRLVCEKRLGRRVMEAADGSSAVQLAEESPPALIILDINMPKMNGITALREIRRLLPETPVVMLSVCANRTVVHECLQAGASAYLRKDTPIEQIFEVLEKFVPRPAAANVMKEVSSV